MIEPNLVVRREEEFLSGGMSHQCRIPGTIDEATEGLLLLCGAPGAELAEGGGAQPLDPSPPRGDRFDGILADLTV